MMNNIAWYEVIGQWKATNNYLRIPNTLVGDKDNRTQVDCLQHRSKDTYDYVLS